MVYSAPVRAVLVLYSVKPFRLNESGLPNLLELDLCLHTRNTQYDAAIAIAIAI
jgi:hypothetical protein